MFNITFWAVTQPFGQNNPFAELVHIIRSTGLYLTQHFLECTVYCLDRMKNTKITVYAGPSSVCIFFLLHYYSYFFFIAKKYHAVCQSISHAQLLWCVHVCKQMQSVSLSSTSVSLLFPPCCLTGFTTPFFVC